MGFAIDFLGLGLVAEGWRANVDGSIYKQVGLKP